MGRYSWRRPAMPRTTTPFLISRTGRIRMELSVFIRSYLPKTLPVPKRLLSLHLLVDAVPFADRAIRAGTQTVGTQFQQMVEGFDISDARAPLFFNRSVLERDMIVQKQRKPAQFFTACLDILQRLLHLGRITARRVLIEQRRPALPDFCQVPIELLGRIRALENSRH